VFLEVVIVLALVVLGVTMYFKFREKPVDMNHQAPNVHNVVQPGRVGPATAADKPAAPAKKKVAKKKVVKKKAVKK
jgi:hypothetical protein